jgi:hypothetical protein
MSRKPDYWVKAMDKATNAKAKVGAAWKNPDGSVSIDLNAFVVLTASPDLVITCFPVDRATKENYDAAS